MICIIAWMRLSMKTILVLERTMCLITWPLFAILLSLP